MGLRTVMGAAPTTRETAAESLNDLLAKAVEHVKAMTPEEREAMHERQKKAWVAAEMAIGDEGTRVVTGHRETADHAELARLAEAAKRVRRDSLGRLDGLDASRKWDAFIAAANPARVLSLMSEIAALRGALEEAEKDVSSWSRCAGEVVTIGENWKERFVQAEFQRDEAVGLLRVADAAMANITAFDDEIWSVIGSTNLSILKANRTAIRAFLANQGAE